MQQIDVFVTEDSNGQPKVTVSPEMIGIHSGEDVLWSFHTAFNDATTGEQKVGWAMIEFAADEVGRKGEFFESRSQTRSHVRMTQLRHGHGHIMGSAPELQRRPGSRKDKYTVRFYAEQPNLENPLIPTPIVTEDPVIITCDP